MAKEKFLEEEQIELFRLFLLKALKETKIEEWQKSPNTFVKLSIPKEIHKFVEATSNSDDVLTGIITDLIVKGLISVIEETGSSEHINLLINNMCVKPDKRQ